MNQPPSPPDWDAIPPESLGAALHALQAPLSSPEARAIWNRAAALRLSSPHLFLQISESLLTVADRPIQGGFDGRDARRTLAVARCAYAEALNAEGRVGEAITAFAQAEKEARRAGLDDVRGQALIGTVHVLALAGEHARAARAATRARKLLEAAGDLRRLGKLHMNRGNAFYQQDRYREAAEAYAQAETLMAGIPGEEGTRLGLLMNQGVVATALEQFAEARGAFERAEKLALEGGKPILEAYARYNRSFLVSLQGNYREGLRLLARARVIFEGEGARDMTAACDRARGEIHLDLGMSQESLELSREAAEGFEREGMHLDAVLSRIDEARALVLRDRPEEAIPLLEGAVKQFTSRRNRPRAGFALLHLAEADLARGQHRGARERSLRAQTLFEGLGLGRWVARASVEQARGWLSGGDADRAERALEPALERVREIPLPSRQEVLTVAGRVALARGRWAEARRRLNRAAEMFEAERQFVPGLEMRSASFERRAEVYHDLIRLALRRPRFETLFRLTELARGRTFRDLARRSSHTEGTPLDRDRALLGALAQRLEEAEFALGDGTEGHGIAEVSTLRRRVLSMERKILRERRREEEQDTLGLHDAQALPATKVAEMLGANETLVSYFVLQEQVVALTMSPTRRRWRVLPDSPEAIETAVGRVAFQMDSALLAGIHLRRAPAFLRRSAETALHALHRMLIDPLDLDLPEEGRLTVVPHRLLHHVPFEVLHDGRRYLSEKVVVARIPVTELLLRPAPVLEAGQGEIVLAGTARGGPAEVRRELDTLAALLRGASPRVLLDPTTRELLETLPRAGLLHLAAHGYFRSDNPLFSRISTGDGALFLADVLDCRLQARMVVLSACNSARVRAGGGEEVSGVAQGFLAAGAQSLVAGLWAVHDEATVALMEELYRGLRSAPEAGVASALRDAGRKARERWDHPAYWGGFAAFEGRPLGVLRKP